MGGFLCAENAQSFIFLWDSWTLSTESKDAEGAMRILCPTAPALEVDGNKVVSGSS